MFPVIKVLSNPVAYLNVKIISHRNIPTIKQNMQIRSQKQAIIYPMRTGFTMDHDSHWSPCPQMWRK